MVKLLEPEVRLVEIWLNSRNYLTMTNIRIEGGKEIDILGAQIDGGELKRKCHIEVSCWSGGSLRGTRGERLATPADVAEYFVHRKFLDGRITKKVSAILGESYDRIWVINSLLQFEREKEQILREFLKRGVKIRFIKEIIEEIKAQMKKRRGSREAVLRTIELVASI